MTVLTPDAPEYFPATTAFVRSTVSSPIRTQADASLVLNGCVTHLFWARPSACRCVSHPREYLGLMAETELGEMQRFRFERDRTRYLWTRVLLRTSLSRLSPGVDPCAWQFRRTEFGRPEVVGPERAGEIFFNVSHTSDFIACVIGPYPQLGVDVEDTTRGVDFIAIARSVFTEPERRELADCPPSERRDFFFRHWVLKEAYVKAVGVGLTIPLNSLSFRINAGLSTLQFSGPVQNAGNWRFALVRFDENILALAVGQPHRRDGAIASHTL